MGVTLSKNDINFLQKLSERSNQGKIFAKDEDWSDADCEAFRKLKQSGLVEGQEYWVGMTARITADGIETLDGASFLARNRVFWTARATNLLDNALSYFVTLVIGIMFGWLLSGTPVENSRVGESEVNSTESN